MKDLTTETVLRFPVAMTVLSTERLQLRELTMNDVDNLAGIFTDSEAMKHYPSTKNREETEGWIRWNLAGYAKNGHGLWAAEFKETGIFAGQCGLITQEVDGNLEVELGYLFLREYWCRGLATEAAQVCRDHAFNSVGATRVISLITPGNLASIRVAEKVGLKFDREIRKWDRPILLYTLNAP